MVTTSAPPTMLANGGTNGVNGHHNGHHNGHNGVNSNGVSGYNGTGENAKPRPALAKVDTNLRAPTTANINAGCQPDAVYAATLSPWRDSVRRSIVSALSAESEHIARIQKRVRTPARDKYFFWSAVLGTHTFFTAFLPLLFWMGYPDRGRGLTYVVGLGIYLSCVAKDLACTPRPFSPPVTRLSISTHHREYGFPSSHSTNSISIALFAGGWLWEERDIVGLPTVLAGFTVLFLYFVTVAGGRVYTGMHSMIDIIGGTLLGTFCWILWEMVGPTIERLVETGSLWVAAFTVPLALSLIHYHPETPDDCPCFEDAIAIVSVMLGIVLGHLNRVRNPVEMMPSMWMYGPFWGTVKFVVRVVVGITCIVVWRLIAKKTLLRVLPPLFRFSSKILPLPTRKFYTPATQYSTADLALHTSPSFGQLPIIPVSEQQNSRSRTPSPSNGADDDGLRMRATKTKVRPRSPSIDPVQGNSNRPLRKKGEQHYDAEVLTKFIVYVGIGIIASTLVSLLFPSVEGYLGIH